MTRLFDFGPACAFFEAFAAGVADWYQAPVLMAHHSQHQQGNPASKCSGAGQAIVELCAVSQGGLTFWSRQRFEIGSELQIRVKSDAIPDLHLTPEGQEEWVSLRGFVIASTAVRRSNGEHGFEVSLLLDSALTTAQPATPSLARSVACPKMKRVLPGLQRVGLN